MNCVVDVPLAVHRLPDRSGATAPGSADCPVEKPTVVTGAPAIEPPISPAVFEYQTPAPVVLPSTAIEFGCRMPLAYEFVGSEPTASWVAERVGSVVFATHAMSAESIATPAGPLPIVTLPFSVRF